MKCYKRLAARQWSLLQAQWRSLLVLAIVLFSTQAIFSWSFFSGEETTKFLLPQVLSTVADKYLNCYCLFPLIILSGTVFTNYYMLDIYASGSRKVLIYGQLFSQIIIQTVLWLSYSSSVVIVLFRFRQQLGLTTNDWLVIGKVVIGMWLIHFVIAMLTSAFVAWFNSRMIAFFSSFILICVDFGLSTSWRNTLLFNAFSLETNNFIIFEYLRLIGLLLLAVALLAFILLRKDFKK